MSCNFFYIPKNFFYYFLLQPTLNFKFFLFIFFFPFLFLDNKNFFPFCSHFRTFSFTKIDSMRSTPKTFHFFLRFVIVYRYCSYFHFFIYFILVLTVHFLSSSSRSMERMNKMCPLTHEIYRTHA